jgi:hypothetical protein
VTAASTGGNNLMTRADRRKLVRVVFDTPLADGTPAGVYVSQEGNVGSYRPKKWAFKIRGRLEFEAVTRAAGR